MDAPAAPIEAELLDRPDLPLAETHRSLLDLRRINRWLLGNRMAARTLRPRLRADPRRQRLLDVGTGTGDVAADLADAPAETAGLTVVGVDRKLSHLVLGRRLGNRQLRVVASATALPFRDGTFGWTMSTLLFHHFDRPGKLELLGEMRRVATRGAVIVDLRRSFWARWLIRFVLPLLGASRITLHDGLVSERRSSTVGEVAAMLRGQPVEELRRRFPCRYSVVVRAADGPAAGPGRAEGFPTGS